MSILDCDPIQCALEAVQDSGLNISKVGILTRVWAEKLGKDTPADSVVFFEPTPRIRSISLRQTNEFGGTIQKGDIQVRMLAKGSYSRDQIDCVSDNPLIELYYYIDNLLYEVVDIEEKLTHYNVTVRKSKKRKLYL